MLATVIENKDGNLQFSHIRDEYLVNNSIHNEGFIMNKLDIIGILSHVKGKNSYKRLYFKRVNNEWQKIEIPLMEDYSFRVKPSYNKKLGLMLIDNKVLKVVQ